MLSNNYFLQPLDSLGYRYPNTTFQLSDIYFLKSYPNTTFSLSDIQFIAIQTQVLSFQTSSFKAIQTLSFNQLCLVYSYLSCHFFMSIVSLLLSNDQFLTMSMMSLLTKSYLKTSFLTYKNQFYSILCISKSSNNCSNLKFHFNVAHLHGSK